MRYMRVWLGVPNLGIIKQIYDFDNDGDCEAIDKNIANGCMLLRMEQMSITEYEEENERQEEVRKKRKALRVITGGKGPPDPPEEVVDWLSPMKRFTIFLASSPKLGLDLLEYHVIVKTKKSIKLAINEGQIIRWVDPKDFCKKFILHEIIQIPVEEENV